MQSNRQKIQAFGLVSEFKSPERRHAVLRTWTRFCQQELKLELRHLMATENVDLVTVSNITSNLVSNKYSYAILN